ncbi:MAG: glutamate--tRNA ligase [Blastochloris sp.]|nr:glutamate--tRNA ligase [Blastochloris sp.]
MSSVRVRFAPSPTGMLHIGSARSALFNWLYARHCGGTFVLRIEDTDKARNTPEAVAAIFSGLRWLGLDWDEGAMEGGENKGDYGPYHQSQRTEIYQKYGEKLLSSGQAYREPDGSIRFKMPKTPGVVKDLICGEITFERMMEPDPTIFRKDGSPVFHFVNVVDDLEMKITHVIRGEDHLSNTHKHIALFEALGEQAPAYAHIPLILNPGGSKMSKREEGAAVGQYIEQGYLAEAVRNYLCLLGWSPKDNREILKIAEVIEKFDLPQINRSNARFDINKLYWINGEHWRELSAEDYHAFARRHLSTHGVDVSGLDPAYLNGALDIIREKIKLGRDLPEWLDPFLKEEFEYDAKAVEKSLKAEGAAQRLTDLITCYQGQQVWKAAELEQALVQLAESQAVKTGLYVHPCRVGVSGRGVGPSLYHMLEVLGQERVVKRLERTRELLGSGKI